MKDQQSTTNSSVELGTSTRALPGLQAYQEMYNAVKRLQQGKFSLRCLHHRALVDTLPTFEPISVVKMLRHRKDSSARLLISKLLRVSSAVL